MILKQSTATGARERGDGPRKIGQMECDQEKFTDTGITMREVFDLFTNTPFFQIRYPSLVFLETMTGASTYLGR